MFFRIRSDYVAELERIGNEALGRLRAKDATVDHQRNLALNELKQLAVQKAITSSSAFGEHRSRRLPSGRSGIQA